MPAPGVMLPVTHKWLEASSFALSSQRVRRGPLSRLESSDTECLGPSTAAYTSCGSGGRNAYQSLPLSVGQTLACIHQPRTLTACQRWTSSVAWSIEGSGADCTVCEGPGTNGRLATPARQSRAAGVPCVEKECEARVKMPGRVAWNFPNQSPF